ncbi:MAG TPA: hypothetical protein VFL53_06475 [Pseudolabrys sp.]|nr:hypothetical protein [Pseudolabrys sp.]
MRTRVRRAVWIVGALAFVAMRASAQEQADVAPLTPEDSALLANALVFDPGALSTAPKKALRLPGYKDGGYDITRTQKTDGSTTVVVKQPLQTEWSNSLGADLAPPTAYPLSLPSERNDDTPAGAAWASVGVPNLASVDARVDPANEQGKVGTTIKHSIPFGGRFAMTVQGTYSVTETLGQPSTGAGDLPLMTLPPLGAPAAQQVFGNEKAVKFNILPTGTTLGAGFANASNDPVTHNTFSADQKLYGPLHVTTAVTDLGQATSNRSITAGFKLHW